MKAYSFYKRVAPHHCPAWHQIFLASYTGPCSYNIIVFAMVAIRQYYIAIANVTLQLPMNYIS